MAYSLAFHIRQSSLQCVVLKVLQRTETFTASEVTLWNPHQYRQSNMHSTQHAKKK